MFYVVIVKCSNIHKSKRKILGAVFHALTVLGNKDRLCLKCHLRYIIDRKNCFSLKKAKMKLIAFVLVLHYFWPAGIEPKLSLKFETEGIFLNLRQTKNTHIKKSNCKDFQLPTVGLWSKFTKCNLIISHQLIL